MASSSILTKLRISAQTNCSRSLLTIRTCSIKSSPSESRLIEENEKKETPSPQNNNSFINPMFFNRNPRNLEQLTIARKPQGFHLDRGNPSFWHKLVLTTTRAGITAQVVHNSGSIALSVSTVEFGIRKHLHNTQDVTAHKALGKILARRCLESGIHAMTCEEDAKEGTKMDFLLKEAQQNGLCFKEPAVYKKPARWGKAYPTKPWDVIT